MWSQPSARADRRAEAADAGTATLEYVGMIALAATLVLAVCGAMQTSALSAVASNAVHCVTTFECSDAGTAPSDTGPVTAAAPPVATSRRTAAAAQPDGAAAPQRQLPGVLGGATSAGTSWTNDPVRSPFPWLPRRLGPVTPPWWTYPVEPPRVTPPWNPIGRPLPPRIVWCEVNVGCN